MERILLTMIIFFAIAIQGCGQNAEAEKMKTMDNNSVSKDDKSEAEWKKVLTREEYDVLRNKCTEPAFTGYYNDHYERGIYKCAGCGNVLFSSDTKYKSGSGWPSFYNAESDTSIVYKKDNSHGMHRIEILCAKCNGHLGHVFNDGPKPTGLRYCINSVALDFEPENKEK